MRIKSQEYFKNKIDNKNEGLQSILKYFFVFGVSASRSLINLFGQSQIYLKNQRTKSKERPLEESYIRSNAKIVVVFTSVRHRAR